MSAQALVKQLGRELHKAADDIETEETHDHAERQANFGAAKALRTVADTIGWVLIETEDFQEKEPTTVVAGKRVSLGTGEER